MGNFFYYLTYHDKIFLWVGLPIFTQETIYHVRTETKQSVGDFVMKHIQLSEPEFYGDLAYRFRKIVGRHDFSDQFREVICSY